MARQHCEKHGFSLMVAEADYNVAYLHYLRGEYLRAIELYDQTRVLCADWVIAITRRFATLTNLKFILN